LCGAGGNVATLDKHEARPGRSTASNRPSASLFSSQSRLAARLAANSFFATCCCLASALSLPTPQFVARTTNYDNKVVYYIYIFLSLSCPLCHIRVTLTQGLLFKKKMPMLTDSPISECSLIEFLSENRVVANRCPYGNGIDVEVS
jgi:hypothetical protein